MAKKKENQAPSPEDLALGGLFAGLEETQEEPQKESQKEVKEASKEATSPQKDSTPDELPCEEVEFDEAFFSESASETAAPEMMEMAEELWDEVISEAGEELLAEDSNESWDYVEEGVSFEETFPIGKEEEKKARGKEPLSKKEAPLKSEATSRLAKPVVEKTQMEVDEVLDTALQVAPAAPDDFLWRSTLGRTLGRLFSRQKPLTESAKRTLDAIALQLKDSEKEGSVSMRCADLSLLLLESEGAGADWEARLQELQTLNILMSTEDYHAHREAHAGRGRKEEPFESPAPFVWEEKKDAPEESRLYLTRLFDDEVRLAQALVDHAEKTFPLSEEQLAFVYQFTQEAGCDEGQQAAICRSLQKGLAIISGGPGTGKTRTVGVLLSLLATLFLGRGTPLRFFLAAPTGKATGRLRESLEALLSSQLGEKLANLQNPERVRIFERTLHKWLLSPTTGGARPSAESPLDCEVLVIDEASMMDAHLATRLMRAVAPETRIIILGDKHQLEAVGPGSVFADISDATGPLAEVVSLLSTSHRFREDGVIDKVAKLINQEGEKSPTESTRELLEFLKDGARDEMGYEAYWHKTPQTLEELPDEAARRDFCYFGLSPEEKRWMDAYFERYWAALLPLLKAQSKEDYQQHYSAFVREVSHTRALAAQREGAHSVAAINDYFTKRILEALSLEGLYENNRPMDEEGGIVIDDETRYREFLGRLLIVRQNNDRLGVYNGDVAVVLPALDEHGRPTNQWVADFMDGSRRLRPVMLPKHETAFAITIHQSQGSDFEEIGVFLPNANVKGLASRELLYTGVTRTKGLVHLFGTEEVLAQAMATSIERTSGLVDRLREVMAGKRYR